MDYQLRLKVFWSGEERDQVLSSLSDLLKRDGSVSLFEDISDAFFSESVDLEGLEVQWVKGLFWASDSNGEKNNELPANDCSGGSLSNDRYREAARASR